MHISIRSFHYQIALIYFQLKFQPNFNHTYICWPSNKRTVIRDVLNQSKKPFKYLKRNGDKIEFFDHFKSTSPEFSLHLQNTTTIRNRSYRCYSTHELRGWLNSFDVIYDEESLLHCTLKDSTIGPVLYSSRNFNWHPYRQNLGTVLKHCR